MHRSARWDVQLYSQMTPSGQSAGRVLTVVAITKSRELDYKPSGSNPRRC
jgi:hypothetical protein